MAFLALCASLASCVPGAEPVGTQPRAPRAPGPSAARVRPTAAQAPFCIEGRDSPALGRALMRDEYKLNALPAVTLPADLTWTEDPHGDINWIRRLHTLVFLGNLWAAREADGDARMERRYAAILRDWVRDNPRSSPATRHAWTNLVVGIRATMLACAWARLPHDRWLRDAIIEHGSALSEPAFYEGIGNHALGQDLGLFALGCATGERAWMQVATGRIEDLARASIDAEGVTNEQAVGYQRLNYVFYGRALAFIEGCGGTVDPEIARRHALMPEFIAHASLPSGHMDPIGDTKLGRVRSIADTYAQYVATAGASGPRPTDLTKVYRAGYAFGRTGWGTARPYENEVQYSLRFGPGPTLHGHADGTALNVYGFGNRLLLDSGGPYKYGAGDFRAYVRSARAHNRVVVPDASYDDGAPTVLEGYETHPRWDRYELSTDAWNGVHATRRVLFSRAGYLVVQDVLTSDRPHVYEQLWHLRPGSEPLVGVDRVRTRRRVGNVMLRWLDGPPALGVAEGRLGTRIQGWTTERYGRITPAPVVEAVRTGTTATFLTLIVPMWRTARVSVRDVTSDVNGFSFVVRVGARTERVVVGHERASVRAI